jgi:type IV pilus assembly protein PilM
MKSPIGTRVALSVPSTLAFPAAGIDISSGSIKSMQFSNAHGRLVVGNYTQVPLQEGVFVDGDIEKEDIIVDVLRTLRLKQRVRYAVASLSERKAYMYQIIVPTDQKDLTEAVEFDLEAHVPLPPSETLFDYEVVRSVQGGTVVAVAAFAKRVVETYERVFAAAGIVLRGLEIESHAMVRAALTEKDRQQVVMIVDMGKRSTRIAVADHGAVSYTATVDFGGDMLTTALIKRFNIETAAAEEMKNARGFLLSTENKDVVEAVASSISILRDELVRHVTYWNNPAPDDVPRDPIGRVVIAGGNANMRGLSEYLSGALYLPVVVADVWQNIFSLDEYIPTMAMNESLEYAPAIGLAKKYALNSPW